ncbi:hypothetical protein Asppvi_005374 [Aspergillus pseudoviridinutans]|uniref:BZIP domain-containing protein n=1 Tax=Aspergillus pseudoviridinutans TaxID=1517512 RepID=A0A9P3EV67_9EURO|nr:uncharacterized protein Asppvi_005374 [Aspergillus pseudoviridinutans]GIJ86485.1 hypothetical protein Asppvi_005374 [Aspergillus pseudoviridinutans]
MSSKFSVPETASSGQVQRSGESVGDDYTSSILEDLRRLRTGKRGRTPIDPAQRGLAERRRNQVRKAQRAYRNRKEQEAAFRTNYVADLENRINNMRQSFFDLISAIKKASIIQRHPDLADELNNITRDFLSASQIIKPHSESQRGGRRVDHNSRDGSHPSRLGDSSNIYASCATVSPVSASVPIGMSMPILASHLELFPSPSFGTRTLLPRNFSQRLYFSCIKRAYHLLTSPYADRADVTRVFQYSFQYSDTDTMISTFDTLLRTNADYQTAYVYRLGGAGTHYQKVQAGTNIVQNVPLSKQTPFRNDEDTWFDPRDIEGWLEENGLVIGGAQSYMYLSEFRSLGPCRDMTLCPGPESPEILDWDIRPGVKILNVDQFLKGLSLVRLLYFAL